MDPVTVTAGLKVLGKVLGMGVAAYKAKQGWGLNTEELSAIETLVGGSAELVGMIPSTNGEASRRLGALHTTLVTAACGAAIRDHWAGNARLAPGLSSPSWLRRRFLSKLETERAEDIQSRLRLAVDFLAEPVGEGADGALRGASALVEHPLGSPWYRALWKAFTNPLLEDGEQASLIDLDLPGARLEFERLFRSSYAEGLAAPAGAELARGLFALEKEQAYLLREILVRWVSTWKGHHVFGGAETPGVPNMPLGEIYVQPDGTYEAPRKPPRREPILSLIREFIEDHRIVIVRGDFGQGKSLTARTLACALAEAYVTAKEESSSELIYPVFIKCGEDFTSHEPSLERIVRRALQRQARTLTIDLPVDHEAFALPPGNARVLYLLDGFDEVALTPGEVDDFFRSLGQKTSGTWKAIVFSRKGVIPPQEKLRGIPVLALEHLRLEGSEPGGQVAEWLERWNRLSGRMPITIEQLNQRELLTIAQTPILLFMAAVTWEETHTEGEPVTRAAIYEQFFRQIAAGKCKQDADRHEPVAKASDRLLEQLVELGEIEKPRPGMPKSEQQAAAMLWMLARVAWESKRCLAREEDLTLLEVTNILNKELKIKNDPSALEMVRIGVLLVLQADQHGGNDRILFGHKSFLEFLVARYWADRLKKIAIAREGRRQRDADKLEKQLLGARLLDEEDRSFDFLMEIINGPGWEDAAREELVRWAAETFNNEAPDFGEGEPQSWLHDRRPVLREAALAIGSSTRGGPPIEAANRLSIRTLLGAFWIQDNHARIIAARISAKGASLAGAILGGAILTGAKLYSANFAGANLYNANLTGAILTGAVFTGASLYRARLEGASLRGASLGRANLGRAVLTGAHLGRANLTGASLVDAILEGANLADANLADANLEGAILEGAILTGAILTGANLKNIELSASTYSNTTLWPEGFDPDAEGAIKR